MLLPTKKTAVWYCSLLHFNQIYNILYHSAPHCFSHSKNSSIRWHQLVILLTFKNYSLRQKHFNVKVSLNTLNGFFSTFLNVWYVMLWWKILHNTDSYVLCFLCDFIGSLNYFINNFEFLKKRMKYKSTGLLIFFITFSLSEKFQEYYYKLWYITMISIDTSKYLVHSA